MSHPIMPAIICIGAVYFTLANIDPALRSKLESINLVALFKSGLLADYSLNDVLKPFIDDLKKLNTVSYFIALVILLSLCVHSLKVYK